MHPTPVWVITNGSKTGVGAIYRHGKDWEHCRPAGFLSKKFTNAQRNYHTHEHETIAVLEALMKWEYKLLRQKFTLVTDHKGLEYFKTQPILSPRQTRWWEYLSRFNYVLCWYQMMTISLPLSLETMRHHYLLKLNRHST